MTIKELESWRGVCRTEAYAQAETEAAQAWHLQASAPVPFQHRWLHVQEVARLAVWLAGRTGADAEVVEAAAWLHDVRKIQPKHAKAGAEAAREILSRSDFPAEKIEAVVDAIRNHEGMHRPKGAPPMEPLEAGVLWDADKLSKLGVSALAFLLSAHYLNGLSLQERRKNLTEYVWETCSRTVESMNTRPARVEAEQRYQAMVKMLDAWKREDK